MTSLDTLAANLVPKMLEKFGASYVLMKQADAPHQPALGGNATIASAAIYADGSDNSYNWPGGDFTEHLEPDSYFNVRGFPDGSCDGLAKAVAVTAEKVTITRTLASCAAGSPIGITPCAPYPIKGYIADWNQVHLASGLVKATDLRVMVDPSALPSHPESEGWTFYQGTDPLTAPSYPVGHVFKTFSGESVPLLDVALRA